MRLGRDIGFAFAILLSACVTSRPVDNRPVSNGRDVASLQGTYRNLSEGKPRMQLSWVIWGGKDPALHNAIQTIEVTALDSSTLRVRALADGGEAKKESVFVRGKDFEMQDGRIRLRQLAGISGFHDGEAMVGPYYIVEDIGLDDKGEGTFRQRGVIAGLVFMFLPLAADIRQDARFARVSNPAAERNDLGATGSK